MPKSLVDHFADLPDPRVKRSRRHELRDILVLCVLAVLCGADCVVDIEEFGKAKKDWLVKTLGLQHGIPSHDTIGRVLAALSPIEFAERFVAWAGELSGVLDNEVVAIDGKTMRRSLDSVKGRGPIHLVSAWATKNRLALGQVKTDEKSNEITAIPELLKVLDLSGCIVTIDAMGCQRAIAEQIVEGGADYMLMLKANHPNLHDEVVQFFHDGIVTNFEEFEFDYVEHTEQGHGRTETRRVWTCSDIEWLPGREAWKDLNSIVCVEATRAIGQKPPAIHRRYYLSSIKEPTAAQAAAIVRAHWGVENGLHWVLDIAFREDESRVRSKHAAENFGLIRKFALNMLKRERSARIGIKGKRLKAGWDNDYLKKVLAV